MIPLQDIRRWIQAIGEERIDRPVWRPDKRVFEFTDLDPKTVAYLKLIRVTQSLHSLPMLLKYGLTADFGAVIRIVIEGIDDSMFLLEGNPDTAANVARFVEHFASTTIDNATQSLHQPVPRTKIQSAASRALTSIYKGVGVYGEDEKKMKALREQIWNAFCNSVHSNYSEIMFTYGPLGPHPKFQLSGLGHGNWSDSYAEQGKSMNLEASFAIWFMATKLGMSSLARRIYEAIQKT